MKLMYSSDPRIQLVRKMLGVPPGVQWFEMRCEVGGLVTVKCEFLAEENSSESLAEVGLLPSDYE